LGGGTNEDGWRRSGRARRRGEGVAQELIALGVRDAELRCPARARWRRTGAGTILGCSGRPPP